MEDRLEKFIRNHRKQLDHLDPPKDSWEAILGELDDLNNTNRKSSTLRPLYLFISGMAATLVIGLLGFLSYQYIQGTSSQMDSVSGALPREYYDIEQQYVTEVNDRIKDLEALQIDKTILDDLSHLDAIYQELKSELLSSGGLNQDEIIQALIKNYKTKIDLLEFIQQKYENSTRDEDVSTTEI